MLELAHDCRANPAWLVVDLAEILLPAAEVERLSRLRVLHDCLHHARHLLDYVPASLRKFARKS